MIKTVEAQGNTWLVNKGLDSEIVIPSNYQDIADNEPRELTEVEKALSEWFLDGNNAKAQEKTQEEMLQEKSGAIERHIYSFYTRAKQAQDRGYQAYAQTVIVGMTVQAEVPVTLDSLTIEVMGAVLQIWDEALTLDDYVATKAIELQEHYEKLVKIGMRLKWTKACIDEGKLAIVDNRDSNYPPYPDLGGA